MFVGYTHKIEEARREPTRGGENPAKGQDRGANFFNRKKLGIWCEPVGISCPEE